MQCMTNDDHDNNNLIIIFNRSKILSVACEQRNLIFSQSTYKFYFFNSDNVMLAERNLLLVQSLVKQAYMHTVWKVRHFKETFRWAEVVKQNMQAKKDILVLAKVKQNVYFSSLSPHRHEPRLAPPLPLVFLKPRWPLVNKLSITKTLGKNKELLTVYNPNYFNENYDIKRRIAITPFYNTAVKLSELSFTISERDTEVLNVHDYWYRSNTY